MAFMAEINNNSAKEFKSGETGGEIIFNNVYA
jgi:hypothetical protein